MPLSMVEKNASATIKRVGGKEETRKFLEGLGFVAGADVTVLNKTKENVIVSVKDSRIALGSEMSNKILV